MLRAMCSVNDNHFSLLWELSLTSEDTRKDRFETLGWISRPLEPWLNQRQSRGEQERGGFLQPPGPCAPK